MPNIALIAYDGCYTSSLAKVQDNLHIANAYWRKQHGDTEGQFATKVLSMDGQGVASVGGLSFNVDGDLSLADDCQVIVVPSLFYEGELPFGRKLKQMAPMVDWLRQQHGKGKTIMGHCTSSFIIAETGLLNGGIATTSWWLEKKFRQRYPNIELNIRQLYVEHQRVMTGAAANSEQLMTLRLIERFMGKSIANQCAKATLLNTNEVEQTAFLTLENQLEHNDPLVSKAQAWLQRNMKERFSLNQLADELAVSTRTLIRRFKQVLDETPNRYLQNLRIDTAKRMLENSGLPVESVMLQVGYTDLSSFSRLFQRKTGLTPRAYRQRFHNQQRSGTDG
ncbi:MAG: helix-turn-helix domain-containing protein [Cellvibrionaceae bacterium]|nr:helix-turn-helix domain-containing protein [Cellvibrionaceae bacterium]